MHVILCTCLPWRIGNRFQIERIQGYKHMELPKGTSRLSLLSYRRAHSDWNIRLRQRNSASSWVQPWAKMLLQLSIIPHCKLSIPITFTGLAISADSWRLSGWHNTETLTAISTCHSIMHLAAEQHKQQTNTTTQCVMTNRLWLLILIPTVPVIPGILARGNANLMQLTIQIYHPRVRAIEPPRTTDRAAMSKTLNRTGKIRLS